MNRNGFFNADRRCFNAVVQAALTRSDVGANVYHLAVPVLNRRGEPLAAMGVSFAAQHDVRPYVTPLIQATWQLSSRLG